LFNVLHCLLNILTFLYHIHFIYCLDLFNSLIRAWNISSKILV